MMRTLVRFDPYREVAPLQGEMGPLLNLLLAGGSSTTTPGVWAPAMDVWETDDEIVYAFDLPGIPEETVSIEFENGVLTVSAERERSQQVSAERLRMRQGTRAAYGKRCGWLPSC